MGPSLAAKDTLEQTFVRPRTRRRRAHRSFFAAGEALDLVNNGVCLYRGAERECRIRSTRVDPSEEVVDLRRVFLAAQIIPDLLGQVGGMTYAPARVESERYGAVATAVDLNFLAIGVDAPFGAPDLHLH
jgi:hypothetical protein